MVLYLKPISLVEALKIKNSSNPEELLDNYKFKMLEEAYVDISEILANMNHDSIPKKEPSPGEEFVDINKKVTRVKVRKVKSN